MLKWVTVGILSLQATLSQADILPKPVTHSDFPSDDFATIMLGRDLFHDPILSGNRNISCSSCHHTMLGSADAVALSVGEGGHGLGRGRKGMANAPAHAHVPRNAPALYNLGAREFRVLFHDGRLTRDKSAAYGFAMPDGLSLEAPVSSTLAAQALMPMTSREEMAGQKGENPVADAVARKAIMGPGGAWARIAARVAAIPSYASRLKTMRRARGLRGDRIHITDIANAMAAYMAFEFRSTESPFDIYLAGNKYALTPPQKRGLDLLYGKAGCASCHSGLYQTDHKFHVIGIPQIGPGKEGHGVAGADHGRGAVTGQAADMYRFRTPSLRNVALTAPYGHSGAYPTLRAVIRHHLNPAASLAAFDPASVALPRLGAAGTAPATGPGAPEVARIKSAITLSARPLSAAEIDDLIAFLDALTDPTAITGRLGTPGRVPSGLAQDVLTAN